MPITIQTTFDCIDCNTAALWWAEALEWEFEYLDPARFDELKSAGFCTESDVVELPGGKLNWRDGAAIHNPADPQSRIYFQTVPEPKSVKNRVHIDLHVGPDSREATIDRLRGMVATFLNRNSQGPHEWAVMQDPEGNEFCVA